MGTDGFFEGRAQRLRQYAEWDAMQPRPVQRKISIQDLQRENAELRAELQSYEGGVNYHRLSSRAWEAVAKQLSENIAGTFSGDDLRRAYLSTRAELYKSGHVEGRGFDGKAKAAVPVGEMHEETIDFITNPTKW